MRFDSDEKPSAARLATSHPRQPRQLRTREGVENQALSGQREEASSFIFHKSPASKVREVEQILEAAGARNRYEQFFEPTPTWQMTQARSAANAGAALTDLFDDHEALSFLAASFETSAGIPSSSSDDGVAMRGLSCSVNDNSTAKTTNEEATSQPTEAYSLTYPSGILNDQQQQQQHPPVVVESELGVIELAPDLEAFVNKFNLEFAQSGDAIGQDTDEILDINATLIAAVVDSDSSVSLGHDSEASVLPTWSENAAKNGESAALPLSSSAVESNDVDDDDDDDGDDGEWTPAKKKSIGRHSRRREELVYLRGKVLELEAEMDALKRKQQSSVNPERASSSGTSSGISTTTASSNKTGGSMWGKVVTRQLQERQKAELHNKKLRSALKTQLQVVKSLERILKKRNTFEALLETSESGKRVKQIPGPLGDNNASVFDDLLGDMDRLYADAGKMLEMAGLQSETSSFCKIVVKPNPVSGLVMEIIENKLLPAEPSVAYKTMWRFAGEKGVNNSDYFEVKADTSHDVSKRSFGATFTRGCNIASFRGSQTSKKYLEETRMVIVSKSIMSSVEEPASPAHGLVFEESTWTVLSLLQNPRLSSESITLCQMYSVFVPKCWGPNLQAGILTEFVTTSWEKANAARDQLVEKMLLEEMSKLRI